MTTQNSEGLLVYVGTYTSGESGAVYTYRFDASSGALSFATKTAGIERSSFLTIGPGQRNLYAVSEVDEFEGNPGGAVSAYSIVPSTGGLTYLNRQLSHGGSPCHMSVDSTGRFLLVANYRTGSACVLPIQENGSLGEASDMVQHQGSSVNPDRQEGPHAHSVTLDAGNRYAFVADLGIDRVMIYKLDLAEGKLTPNDVPWVEVKAGAGPRHFDFHPSGGYAYLINELDSTVTAFAYDEATGTLTEIQTAPTLPESFGGSSHCADIHVSPSGRFLYGSNRGHDSITVFSIDQRTGRLTHVAHEPTQGKTPRNFAIDPTGTFLLAANQDSDNIVVFRIDQQTGRLASTGHVADVPRPVSLQMMPVSS